MSRERVWFELWLVDRRSGVPERTLIARVRSKGVAYVTRKALQTQLYSAPHFTIELIG